MNLAERPRTWNAYFDFYKKVQDNLRKKGERKVYGLGFQVSANGVDPAALFNAFMQVTAARALSRRRASSISRTGSGRRRSRPASISAGHTATAMCRRAGSLE